MTDYTTKHLVALGLWLVLGLGSMLAVQAFRHKDDNWRHVQYLKDGKTIDKATYDRELKKDPGSVAECSRNDRTGEVLCAGG